MSEPYIGQIITVGFPFAPKYFAKCDGQILGIQQNQALFSLLGTMYGGNGTTNFALPDLRGRAPFGAFASVDQGWQPPVSQQGTPLGVEVVTLTPAQIPAHTHTLSATSAAASDGFPSTTQALATATTPVYGAAQAMVGLGGGPLSPTGSMPHANMQPFEVLNLCIALSGQWPSRG